MDKKKILEIASLGMTAIGFGLGIVSNVVDSKLHKLELKEEVAKQIAEFCKSND